MMELFFIVIGLVCGVVINGVAADLPRNRVPRVWPHCPHCQKPKSFWQASALTAVLLRRTTCVHCQTGWGRRGVWVELVAAALWLIVYFKFGASLQTALLGLFFMALWLITLIDLETREVIFITVLVSAGLAILYATFGAQHAWDKTLWGGVAGFALSFGLYVFGWVFGKVLARVRGEALAEVPFGFGDVELVTMLGLGVGWSGILVALFLAVLSGGVGAALYLAVQALRRKYSLFTAIPYGPFLVLGAMIMLLFESELRARANGGR